MKNYTLIMTFLLLANYAFGSDLVGKCIKCHGDKGKAPVSEIPTLTGQNKAYLIKQMENFKTGKRRDNLLFSMRKIARSLSTEEIEEISEYYSSFDPKESYREPGKLNARAKKLYEIGAKHAPVCLGCHGLAEMRPARKKDWPYISGQNAGALKIQLGIYVKGTRNDPEMDFMKLPPFNDPEVIRGISLYFSRQSPPSP